MQTTCRNFMQPKYTPCSLQGLLQLLLGWLMTLAFFGGANTWAQGQAVKLQSYTVESSHPATANKWKSTKLEVPATLIYPASSAEKYPAIVYLLSSGGFSTVDQEWINLFLQSGYAVLWVDQYTPRNLSLSTGLGKAQDGMTDMSFLHDAAAAVQFLKTQATIDATRIASFGRSWGGGVQMYMTDRWYASNAMNFELPKVRIALYPACYLTTKTPKPTDGKTYLFLGEKDDWNEPGPCINYAERLKKEGGDITVKVYPDAVHLFEGQRPRSEVNVVVWGRCENVWDTDTYDIENLREGVRFNIKDGKWGPVCDKCVRKAWVKLEGTPQLRQVVQQDVLAVLGSAL